jgi:hypothetical protein
MAAIITTDEVKVFLQISDTSKDDLIDALIPEIEANIKEYCNTDFTLGWPSGMKIIASKMIGYTMAEMSGGGASIGLQSESQGGYSYTRNTSSMKSEGEYPQSILSALDKWKVSRFQFGSKMTQARDKRGLSLESLASDRQRYSVENELYLNEENLQP